MKKHEEKKLLKSIEAGEWKQVKNIEIFKKHLYETAVRTLSKDRKRNLKVAATKT